MTSISPIANSPEIVQQANLQQQVNSVAQTPENVSGLEVTQGLSTDLTNQVDCKQTVAEFLKDKYPEISPEELNIYDGADLKVENVGSRVGLTRPDIDWDFKDANGMTNRERKELGLSPINSEDGLPYELHHVGQKNDAPLAELTHSEHMSPENNKTLHPIRSGSEVDHGYAWRDIREDYWKARSIE